MSNKRPRIPSPSQTSASVNQPFSKSFEPVSKATRTTLSRSSSTSTHNLLCTLPPTCNPPNQPTPLANSKELEAHYATYHAHVCENFGCGCVFPEARLLELHQTECHDPIAALRKDRGEKIFACHLSTCARMFSTPKTRRMHLMQAHGYPKEYFFAVTNKGVGGLLKKWGEGASMVRQPWRARESNGGEDEESEDVESDRTSIAEQGEQPTISRLDDGPLVEDEDEEEEEDNDEIDAVPGPSIDDLTASMDTLSLVPPAIRFGRGAKRGGTYHHDASHGSQRSRHTSLQQDTPTYAGMEVDSHSHGGRGGSRRTRGGPHASRQDGQPPSHLPFPSRGIGARGRGMAFGRGRIAIARGGGGRGGRGRGY